MWPRHGVALQPPISDIVGSCHGMTLTKQKYEMENCLRLLLNETN